MTGVFVKSATPTGIERDGVWDLFPADANSIQEKCAPHESSMRTGHPSGIFHTGGARDFLFAAMVAGDITVVQRRDIPWRRKVGQSPTPKELSRSLGTSNHHIRQPNNKSGDNSRE